MNTTTDCSIPPTRRDHHRHLYQRLWQGDPDADRHADALLDRLLADTAPGDSDPPEDPAALEAWMATGHRRVGEAYRDYLDQRARGGPRRFFQCRAQALYFLRAIAPTKLVDGAWLHGLTRHWQDSRLRPLLRIYLEELGDGQPDRNHVLLYQRLLARLGCETLHGLDDDCYLQGALQLALGRRADRYLPEILGFNLGYEQLPLHLLITAHELAELNIDPHYFTLHITIDNADVGHARQACRGVLDLLPEGDDRLAFYRRVRRGYALNGTGPGPRALLRRFDLNRELERVLRRKAEVGRLLHPDHCRLAGRRLNDWLADLAEGHGADDFLLALQRHGWVQRGRPATQSRFWNLLEGEQASMFGVFDGYERQLLHDWIVDDAAFAAPRRFRRAPRPRHASTPTPTDAECRRLEERLTGLGAREQMALLGEMMAPRRHFTPAGLFATRRYARTLAGL
ncbi:iron-containing redox enzyme family protein [Alcanivorax marinus]|uniref:Iron-containing redox enzyme family protein n=1 Tax=Alloalcanivorax marinus TaxID=1177169 RepID=A0A9Q3UJ95_9GAMM|nr:iron-containing redox enzyme family protein [Alloalcanivorax marinus]MCC4307235.1 iron-containing redox enzyme family protein [Alloalcanivorax marinus]